MDRREASPETVRHYERVAAHLAARGVKASTMFGMPTLKLHGKALAGLHGDAMTFKLIGEAHAEALRLEGAHPFDPSGMGRPMKAWVVVPVAHAGEWERLAQLTLAAIDG
ncbi:MAG: hypothetical protein M3P32_04330 [Chloroflexota bacterium]|nr:hypothetical protein [Chloroflexota bacterium]